MTSSTVGPISVYLKCGGKLVSPENSRLERPFPKRGKEEPLKTSSLSRERKVESLNTTKGVS